MIKGEMPSAAASREAPRTSPSPPTINNTSPASNIKTAIFSSFSIDYGVFYRMCRIISSI